jgi:hypothetical protein
VAFTSPKTWSFGEILTSTDMNVYVRDNSQALFDNIFFLESSEKTADYTLALADLGKVVPFNSTSARTLTVPTNATVAFPIGTVIGVYNMNTGLVTVAAAGGVTVRNAGQLEQFREVSLRKRATNEWVVAGL